MVILAIFLDLVFRFSLVSRRARQTVINGPVIFLERVTNIGANSNIVLVMVATVLLSVLAHGISADPGVKLYARTIAGLGPDAPEYAEIGANS